MVACVSDPSTWWRWRQESLKFKVILELYIKFNPRLGSMKPGWGERAEVVRKLDGAGFHQSNEF